MKRILSLVLCLAMLLAVGCTSAPNQQEQMILLHQTPTEDSTPSTNGPWLPLMQAAILQL